MAQRGDWWWTRGNRVDDVAIVLSFQDFNLYTEWSADNVSGEHMMEAGSGREVASKLLHPFHSAAYDVIVFSKQYQAEYSTGKVLLWIFGKTTVNLKTA